LGGVAAAVVDVEEVADVLAPGAGGVKVIVVVRGVTGSPPPQAPITSGKRARAPAPARARRRRRGRVVTGDKGATTKDADHPPKTADLRRRAGAYPLVA
jgi:hypothetical protein